MNTKVILFHMTAIEYIWRSMWYNIQYRGICCSRHLYTVSLTLPQVVCWHYTVSVNCEYLSWLPVQSQRCWVWEANQLNIWHMVLLSPMELYTVYIIMIYMILCALDSIHHGAFSKLENKPPNVLHCMLPSKLQHAPEYSFSMLPITLPSMFSNRLPGMLSSIVPIVLESILLACLAMSC